MINLLETSFLILSLFQQFKLGVGEQDICCCWYFGPWSLNVLDLDPKHWRKIKAKEVAKFNTNLLCQREIVLKFYQSKMREDKLCPSVSCTAIPCIVYRSTVYRVPIYREAVPVPFTCTVYRSAVNPVPIYRVPCTVYSIQCTVYLCLCNKCLNLILNR